MKLKHKNNQLDRTIPNNWEYENNTNTKAIDERYKRLYDGDKD
jgi:hypothetical protein